MPIGKAKQIMLKGESINAGYFLPDEKDLEEGNASNGDFVSIGKDGGLVARATVLMSFNFFFGRFDSEKGFIQVFPEGTGSKLEVDHRADQVVLDVTTSKGDFRRIFFDLKDSSSCSTTGPSTEGGLANELLVQAFKSNLDELLGAFLELDNIIKLSREDRAGYITDVVKDMKNIVDEKDKRCKGLINNYIFNLRGFIKGIERDLCDEKEGPNCAKAKTAEPFIAKMRDIFSRIKESYKVDDDENSKPDICDKSDVSFPGVAD